MSNDGWTTVADKKAKRKLQNVKDLILKLEFGIEETFEYLKTNIYMIEGLEDFLKKQQDFAFTKTQKGNSVEFVIRRKTTLEKKMEYITDWCDRRSKILYATPETGKHPSMYALIHLVAHRNFDECEDLVQVEYTTKRGKLRKKWVTKFDDDLWKKKVSQLCSAQLYKPQEFDETYEKFYSLVYNKNVKA